MQHSYLAKGHNVTLTVTLYEDQPTIGIIMPPPFLASDKPLGKHGRLQQVHDVEVQKKASRMSQLQVLSRGAPLVQHGTPALVPKIEDSRAAFERLSGASEPSRRRADYNIILSLDLSGSHCKVRSCSV
jgi:hypothetical protein